MTARHREPAHARRVTPKDFPALASFLSGYLHEDFLVEHGSPGQAAAAFLADASPDERRQVDDELRRLLTDTRGWPLGDLRRALKILGAAWSPSDRSELEALAARWEAD